MDAASSGGGGPEIEPSLIAPQPPLPVHLDGTYAEVPSASGSVAIATGGFDAGVLASRDAGSRADAGARRDAGSRDAGGARDASTDAGSRDASADAGSSSDGGSRDASIDAGSRDASTDAGTSSDGGSRDASTDAGSRDASTDAGSRDASTDAGSRDASSDAGSRDASSDAGSLDASNDAGSLDASSDAGWSGDASSDAGWSGDAGARDASSDAGSGDANADAGTNDASAPGLDAGWDAGLGDVGVSPIALQLDTGHNLPGCYRCGVGTADFNGDGLPDVVMAGAFDAAYTAGMSNYTYQNVIRIYSNTSTPGGPITFSFEQELPVAIGGGGAIVVVADFDGNNVPDFAVQFREGNSPGSDTAAYINQGAFTFTRTIVTPGADTNSTSMGIASADIDQDGLDDLISNSDAMGWAPGLWYKYDPTTQTWSGQQTSYSHRITYGGGIAAGDLDGDSYPDIVVVGNSSTPFGQFDCSSTLLYGEIHLNTGGTTPQIEEPALTALDRFALRNDRNNPPPACDGGADNVSVMIADVDGDGHQDVILAGSSAGFRGPPNLNGSHYDFVVLHNVDGSGNNYVTFENAGAQYANGTTNGGSGSVDFPNIAAGDLTGDGLAEVFIQGHHRDYAVDPSRYIFDTRLFWNVGGSAFVEVDLALPEVGEGGQAMADFNADGKIDLLFTGASIPFHTNGSNPIDYNNTSTLFTYVYRNVRP